MIAAELRKILRLHEQMGLTVYPATAELQQFVTGKNWNKKPGKAGGAAPPQRRVSLTRRQATAGKESTDSTAKLVGVHENIRLCTDCDIAQKRQGIVIDSSKQGAGLMIVGDVSRQTQAFSASTLFGTAEDEMLWNMVRAMGLNQEDVYVTNCIKCCLLEAKQADVATGRRCLAFLEQEIDAIRPRIICAMGELAAQAILGSKESLGTLRGRFHQYNGRHGKTAVMVTFHPHFLLDHVEMKRIAWHDLQLIQRRLSRPISS